MITYENRQMAQFFMEASHGWKHTGTSCRLQVLQLLTGQMSITGRQMDVTLSQNG